MTKNLMRRWAMLAAVWSATVMASWPVLFRWTAPAPSGSAGAVAAALAAAAVCGLGFLVYRVELRRLTRVQTISLLMLVLLLTGFVEYTHYFFVNSGSYFPPLPNRVWQQQIQDQIVHLDPKALPHSYRFLPNALVFCMQIVGVPFKVASEIYRGLTMLVLFYALYRFGRLFTTYLGALITMLLVAVVYSVSFVDYAGQLTDPLSHLSFLLAFQFLETDEFFFFLSALLIGSLAKETVLGMLGFYVLFFSKSKGYFWKAPVLVASCLAVYLGVRAYILHGMMGYQQVSGVNRAFLHTNWTAPHWPLHFALTGLAYLPFLALGWKDTPSMLKKLSIYLLPVLFVSSLLFSWLNEARNYMPVVFVLAVVTGRFLVSLGEQPERRGQA